MRRLVVAIVVVASCAPTFSERESLVSSVRVLAVESSPPEAKPGEPVSYRVLVATPSGPVDGVSARWAYCSAPKRLVENGSVSAACLADGAVREIAPAAALPVDGCLLFGPEVTSAELRPRDPDATGGFYQPVRVDVPGAVRAFGTTRLRCTPGGVSAELVSELARTYLANTNPRLSRLVASSGEALVDLSRVPAGASVVLRASWPEEDAERFTAIDVAADRVVARREAMRVSWFTTAGTYLSDRTGRDEEELEAFTENVWTAPDEPGRAFLYLVLRDSRGGVAWRMEQVTVVR